MGLQCFSVADGPETARLVFSAGGITLAFPWDFAIRRLGAGGKVRETRSFVKVPVSVMVCENHCSDCHESCPTCSAMYDMHAIDYDKRGDRYKNMTFWHGFEHNAC